MSERHVINYWPECWGKGSLYCNTSDFWHCEDRSLLLHDYAKEVKEVSGNKTTEELMKEVTKEN